MPKRPGRARAGATVLERLDSEDFCYITTTGRRTGRPHTIEIWFAARGNTAYILAGGGERSDTVRNVRNEPAVRIKVGERTFEATARVVSDASEARLARKLVPTKYADYEEGLEEWAAESLPVAIDIASR